jgi:hypothetical protein
MSDRMSPADLVVTRGNLLASVTRWWQLCRGNLMWTDLTVTFAKEPGLFF